MPGPNEWLAADKNSGSVWAEEANEGKRKNSEKINFLKNIFRDSFSARLFQFVSEILSGANIKLIIHTDSVSNKKQMKWNMDNIFYLQNSMVSKSCRTNEGQAPVKKKRRTVKQIWESRRKVYEKCSTWICVSRIWQPEISGGGTFPNKTIHAKTKPQEQTWVPC